MPAALLATWHCSKKMMSLSKSVGTVLFVSVNFNWCILGCTKKFVCSSLAPWVSPWFDEGSHSQDSWWAVHDNAWTHAWVKIFELKLGSVNARTPNHAWSGAMCPVVSLAPFLKQILMWSGCFRPSSIRLSGMPSAPKEVQWVYQLNWGVFCALIRSDIVTILACFDLLHAWMLIACLLDCAGISPQQRTVIIVMDAPVDEQISHWTLIKKQYEEVEYVAVKQQR